MSPETFHVYFIGGAWDSWLGKMMLNQEKKFRDNYADKASSKYFEWNEKTELLKAIENKQDSFVAVIAHSWGAHSTVDVLKRLKKNCPEKRLNFLALIDGVSLFRGFRSCFIPFPIGIALGFLLYFFLISYLSVLVATLIASFIGLFVVMTIEYMFFAKRNSKIPDQVDALLSYYFKVDKSIYYMYQSWNAIKVDDPSKIIEEMDIGKSGWEKEFGYSPNHASVAYAENKNPMFDRIYEHLFKLKEERA